jgi:hypothetical protein
MLVPSGQQDAEDKRFNPLELLPAAVLAVQPAETGTAILVHTGVNRAVIFLMPGQFPLPLAQGAGHAALDFRKKAGQVREKSSPLAGQVCRE